MPTLPTDPIFISYSRRDDATMKKIAFFLRDQGFKVWVDNEKLIPGTAAWEESIENAIKKAFAVIVILSPDSNTSEWVRREITYSDQFQKRLFPVLVKGTEETSLPLRLVTRQYVDLRNDEEDGLKALLAAIMFFVEQRKTQEMKRPILMTESTSKSKSTPISTRQTKSRKSVSFWILSAGAFMMLCILGLAVIWGGYRLFSGLVPVTGPDSSAPTFTSDAPTEELPDSTVEAVTEAPIEAEIPAEVNIPTPDLLAEYFDEYQLIHVTTFDDPTGGGWNVQAGGIENGVMEIVGNPGNDGAWFTEEFVEGNAILMDFNFTNRSTFVIYINFGAYGTDSFRRLGLFLENGAPLTDIYQGEEYIWAGFSGDLSMEAGTKYTILLAMMPDGELLEVVWNPANPGPMLEYQNQFDETWAGLPWTLVIQANKGTIKFDNFQIVQFSGVK